MVRRPELFGAVVLNAAILSPIQLENNGALGPLHAREFGSSTTPEGASTLRQIDAYSLVERGKRYPATLLLAGAADFRVPSWQATKMHAKLKDASPEGGPFLLRVDTDGHQGAVVSDNAAENDADVTAFLLWRLGHPDFR